MTRTMTRKIRIDFGQWPRVYKESGHCEDPLSLNQFARDDGFQSWFELFQFWREEHGGRLLKALRCPQCGSAAIACLFGDAG